MAAADDQPRSGVSRRDALRLLAASTTTVAAGSLIVSQPAFADSGSETCRFGFTGSPPSVSVQMINQTGNRSDFLSITVSNVSGDCPCATRTAPYEYAYFITIPGTGSGGTPWITSSAVSVISPNVLWPNAGGSATISVGIRVTCPTDSGTGTAVRCRFGTSTFTIGRNQDGTYGFTLGSDNGGSNPAGLPSCDSGPLAAPQLRSRALTTNDGLVIQPGAGIAPTVDPNAVDQPSVDLGTPDSDTTTTTTTTTDKPGNGPKPKPTESTTTTTTTTPPSTTTSAPSTTAPPSTSTTPPSTSTTTSTTLPPGG